MKRIYVLQYPDGTFWDGWEKHTDPLRTMWYDAGTTQKPITMSAVVVS